MGSHYIPVGKIKIDKEILDIACPAAGYGFTPPPPEIYCPTHGYVKDEVEKWESPYEVPDPPEGAILLIYENSGDIGFSGTVQTRGGVGSTKKIHVTFKNMAGDILDEFDGDVYYSSNYFIYNSFPASGDSYIQMIIAPQDGNVITKINTYATGGVTNNMMKIVEARINTPDIIYLDTFLSQNTYINKVSLLCKMDSLTNMNNFLEYSNIRYFKFPSYNYPALISLNKFAQYSSMETVDFNNAKFPFLENLAYFLTYCKNIRLIKNFNPGTTKLNNMSYFVNNCYKLTGNIDLSVMTVDSASINMTYAFYNTSIKTLKYFKTTQKITISGNYPIGGSNLLEKIDYSPLNDYEAEFTMSLGLQSLPSHVETISPKILKTNSGNFFGASNSPIEKLVLPDYFYGSGSLSPFASLKNLIGTPECDSNIHDVSITSPTIASFNIPTMAIKTIILGSAGGNLSEVVVDWANSFTHSFTATTVLVNLKGNLNTSTIDAIFTALPTIPAGRIDVKSNPGYAACDKSIATAKNWTVL